MSRRWILLSCTVVSGVIIDQWTKHLAEVHLPQTGVVTVLEGFFELRLARNRGAFFSFGADLPDGVRVAFFVIMTALAVGLLLRMMHRSGPDQRRLHWALSLLMAGAVGNLIDRVRVGEVVDFLHLHLRDVFHWATFNAADVYIAVGLGYLLWDLVRPEGQGVSLEQEA